MFPARDGGRVPQRAGAPAGICVGIAGTNARLGMILPEPERRLLTRSDHYSFMQIGVPAVGFIFGYEKGTAEEAVYRRWYAERYHSPADDLNQPWDPPAAVKFNDFFQRLVEALANAPERPRWNPASTFAR